MKVIFLDIDGVLINRKSCMKRYDCPDEGCVANFNTLLERTGAKIVMSSCWRVGRTVPELQKLLDNWGVKGAVVIDKTPSTNFNEQRGTEIGRWLKAYTGEPIESFIIIDDDADMGQFLPRLVHTRFEPGLTKNDVEMAVKLFEKHKVPAEMPGPV